MNLPAPLKSHIAKSLGPISISALSLFIAFHILQPFALALDPSFNLLASKGVGKIAFMTMVILQCILFIAMLPISFLRSFYTTNVLFLKLKRSRQLFSSFFISFFILHALVLLIFTLLGFAHFDPAGTVMKTSVLIKLLIGFIATFFLAYSEELIFRGTLYPYFALTFSPLTSAIITSFIFSLAHNLAAPWHMFINDWPLGVGLFLLGLMLNLIFIITGSLAAGMGAHAGLVYLKVILRKAPFVVFAAADTMPWWVSGDLRESFMVHGLFLAACVFLVIRIKRIK